MIVGVIVGVSGASDVGGRRDRTDHVGLDRIDAMSSDSGPGGEPDEEAPPELMLCILRVRFGRPPFRAAIARRKREVQRRQTAPGIFNYLFLVSDPTDRHPLTQSMV